MLNMIRLLSSKLYKQNKGRNLVAILAIVLTTLMFTTLFVLSQSMSENLVEMAFRQTGNDAHASIKVIEDDQIERLATHSDVKEVGRSIVAGLAVNADLTGRQVEVRYGSDNYAKHSFAYPTTGTMPRNSSEIALDDIVLDRLGIPHEVGQEVTIYCRKDFTSDEIISSTYTLSGFWEGNTSSYASMAWISEEAALEACDYASNNGEGGFCGQRMAQVILYSAGDMEGTMDRILADLGLTELRYNINLAFDPSMQAMATMESLPMYIGMVLVFVAGYLIIYNIFQISVASDIQLYGKLKTLGTTKKQIKKLIFEQANRLCLVGIPIGLVIGYLLGVILVPVLISGLDTDAAVSANPIIFIGSTVFAWLTVLISCLRPAKIAGKVSPMEALRYSEAQGSYGTKKSRKGASIARMAWSNLGRNKKRTITVICSLTLGLVLLSCFYAKNASFDMEMYLNDLTIADFAVEDATHKDINGYNPQSRTISEELHTKVMSLEGLEDMGYLYSQEILLPLSAQTLDNIEGFYSKYDRVKSMEYAPYWVEGYYETLEEKTVTAVIYGGEGLVLDVLAQPRYLMDGVFDLEKFATGEYIMAFGIGSDDYSEKMPTVSVGEKITVGEREYTVMGILFPLEPVTGGYVSAEFHLGFLLPAESFQQYWPDNGIRKLYANVADDGIEEAEAMLTEYQRTVDSTMPFTSRQTMVEQYQRETRSQAVMGNAISVVIALVGVLNFVNSMVTAIVSRKKEFAMIQSVGMTKRQLRRMLVCEGLDYAGLTLAVSYLLSVFAVGVVVRAMVESGYSTFRFTLLPLMVCTPLILIFAVLIPYICFKNLEKQSIVERLRLE